MPTGATFYPSTFLEKVMVDADVVIGRALVGTEFTPILYGTGKGSKGFPALKAAKMHGGNESSVSALPGTMLNGPIAVLKLLATHFAVSAAGGLFLPFVVTVLRTKAVLSFFLDNVVRALKVCAASVTCVGLSFNH